MKLLALTAFFCGLAMAAPVADPMVARAVTTAKSSVKSSSSSVKPTSSVQPTSSVKPTTTGTGGLGINVGGSSSPLVGVSAGSSTILAVNVGTTTKAASVSVSVSVMSSVSGASSVKTASLAVSPSATIVVSVAKTSLVAASAAQSTPLAVSSAQSVIASTITSAPTSTQANPTSYPSTFTAPVQGTGVLSVDNLPALPAVIDKTFSGALGSVYGLMSGLCNTSYQCSITVAGTLTNLLVDGNQYSGSTTLSAWCAGGRCYGSANPTVNATSPFTVTCDTNGACSATIAGAARAIFTNGQQVEAWGWITPAGYCQNGVCTASIKAYGDPMY